VLTSARATPTRCSGSRIAKGIAVAGSPSRWSRSSSASSGMRASERTLSARWLSPPYSRRSRSPTERPEEHARCRCRRRTDGHRPRGALHGSEWSRCAGESPHERDARRASTDLVAWELLVALSHPDAARTPRRTTTMLRPRALLALIAFVALFATVPAHAF